MKINTVIMTLLCLGSSCLGIDLKDAQNAWNDISVFRINKEPARAFFVPYADSSKVPVSQGDGNVENLYENTDRAKVLNGKWKFFFAEKPEEVSPEFFNYDFDDSKWSEIEVPNSWQACGYDSIFYANINLEMFFDKNGRWLKGFHKGKGEEMSQAAKSPFIPEMHRQKAVYRTSFELPKGWADRETIIRFNGVRTGFFLYVNGEKVGYSEDSFTPAEFNISKFLKSGKNSLAVEVFKNTTGAYYEMQDMPHMMGIIRDVVLLSRPKTYIRDYFADIKLNDKLDEAKVNLTVFLSGRENSKVSASIVDKNGNAVFKKSANASGGKAEISGLVKNFKLWSSDKPDFYTLILEESQNGKVSEAVAADIAFRKFEIDGKTCRLNGKRFLIKGANVHAWSPDKGKACDFKWMKKDVELMREANINAVRTSHYPPDDKFLMLCTRYGITIMDEANFETHGLRDEIPGDNEWFFAMSLDRMKNMVLRDRNVPCVIIWSLGNENAWRFTKNHQVMLDFAREFGGGRPVHSEVEMRDPLTLKNERLNSPTDFVSGMYGGLPRIKWYQTKMRNETRPFIFCEYMHSMGNSTGNLKEIFDEFRKDPSLNGGYLWDWVDQSLLMPLKENPNEKYLTYGIDWGTKPSSNNFCLNGVIFADRTYSGKFDDIKRVHQNAWFEDSESPFKFKVSNEFTATNLNEFDFEVEVLRNGKVVAKRAQKPLNIAPWESAEIEIDAADLIEKDKKQAENSNLNGEYFINISLKEKQSGKVVAKHQRHVGRSAHIASSCGYFNFKKLSENKDFIVFRASCFSNSNAIDLKFSKKDAALVCAVSSKDKSPLITEPLDFDISQAWIDSMKPPMRDYEMYGLDNLKTEKPQVVFDGRSVLCKKFLLNEDGAGFLSEIKYSPGMQGVKVDCKFTKVNDLPEKLNLARIGVRMGIEKSLKNVEYYGRGPLANYCDRKTGADVGIYSSDVKSFLELFPKTQDTGNREDVRNMILSSDKAKYKLAFVALDRPLPFAILPNSQVEMKNANHPHELPQNSNSELRIAWNVFGIGNSSHGPETLDKYRHFFKGSVKFRFKFGLVDKDMTPEKLAEEISYTYPMSEMKEGENLQDESLFPKPSGKVISYGADVKLSSVDERWSPKVNDFTTEGAQNFAFHTLKEVHPNVVVDLKTPQQISGIQLSNRADHMAFRTAPIGVYISLNGKDWEKIFVSKLAKKRWHINLKEKKTARFIKVVLEKPEAEALHLKKIVVF